MVVCVTGCCRKMLRLSLLILCTATLCSAAVVRDVQTSKRSVDEGVAGIRSIVSKLSSDIANEALRKKRQADDSGSASGTTQATPFTLPGGLTWPTLPENFTLPTFTIPTLPETLPSIPTLPGGSTLPPNITFPTIPDNLTIPTDITIPSTITLPTLPGNVTLTVPTLPFNITIPPDIFENVTLPPIDITLPPFDNFTLPPLDNITFPPLDNFSFPTDLADIFPSILPSGITDLLTGVLTGDIPTFDSIISNALTTGVSDECAMGWTTLFNSTDSNGISDGLRAVDSFGKIGAGFVQGNMYALGSYDECFSLPNTKYCLSDLVVLLDGGGLPNPELFYAICLPQVCSIDDILNGVNSTNEQLSFFNVTIEISSVSCESETKPSYNAGAILMILVWVLIAAAVLGATTLHLVLKTVKKHRQNKEGTEVSGETSSTDDPSYKQSTILKLAFTLSLYKNIPAILSTEQTQPKSHIITSLDGIKVLSLVWIILGHTQLWSIFFDSNSSHLSKNVLTRFSYQAILSSPFGYDSFFLLSGVLLAYVTLRKMAVKSKRKYAVLLTHYIQRILHFMPVYAIILFTGWLLTVYFADGPLWQRTIGDDSKLYENCNRYWWTNLFYINNLYPWANLDECMPWTWYVSTEIQFFVIAPAIVLPLALFYPIGLIIVGALLIGNVVLLGVLTGTYDLNASIFLDLDLHTVIPENIEPDGHNSIDDIHIKPWARIGPFVLGILLGFLIYKKVRPAFKLPINQIVYTCLWVTAFGLCFSNVYGLYGAYDSYDALTEGEEIAYQMFSRLSWSLGLAIVIYSCHNGYGWIINDFLSMKMWKPLNRLSLITYLIHPIVLFVLFYTRRAPVYNTDITLTVYTIATVVLSYGAAAIIACFVDRPLFHIETAILGLVGFKKTIRGDTQEGSNEEEIEERGEGHENYYFREMEKEDLKRMEAELEDETTVEEGVAKDITQI